MLLLFEGLVLATPPVVVLRAAAPVVFFCTAAVLVLRTAAPVLLLAGALLGAAACVVSVAASEFRSKEGTHRPDGVGCLWELVRRDSGGGFLRLCGGFLRSGVLRPLGSRGALCGLINPGRSVVPNGNPHPGEIILCELLQLGGDASFAVSRRLAVVLCGAVPQADDDVNVIPMTRSHVGEFDVVLVLKFPDEVVEDAACHI